MSLKNPLISILIPTYNRANYIKQAVDSVIAQDYRPIEIIIIDDGSTDDTKEIIERNYDKSIVKYFYQKNKGISGARNTCLSKTKGEYIAWLDSDDYYLPGKLTAQMNYMREHPDCEIVFTKYKNIVREETLKKNKIVLFELEREVTNKYCVVSCLIKSDVYKKIGKFNINLLTSEDCDMFIRAKKFKININHFINRTFYCRLLHGNNISMKYDHKTLLKNFVMSLSNNIKNGNLISVIIPVKNGSNYLREAVDGIKKQKMNTEIIVVDDGSTDNTADIAEELGCMVIKNPKNLGQDVSKNIGLKRAKGNYILFHDHDDVMRENALMKMYKEFELNKDLQVVMAKLKDFVSPELKDEKISVRKEAYYGSLAGAVLFRKEVFDVIGNFDESTNVGGLDILLRLEKYGIKTKKINITAVNRRIHNTNYGKISKQREYKDYATILKNRLLKK